MPRSTSSAFSTLPWMLTAYALVLIGFLFMTASAYFTYPFQDVVIGNELNDDLINFGLVLKRGGEIYANEGRDVYNAHNYFVGLPALLGIVFSFDIGPTVIVYNIVSIVIFLVTCFMVALASYRKGNTRFVSIIWSSIAGLSYLGIQPLIAGNFVIGRSHALMVILCVAALVTITISIDRRSIFALTLSAALCSAAILTMQHSSFVGIAITIYLFINRPIYSFIFVALGAIFTVPVIFYLYIKSEGGFLYWTALANTRNMEYYWGYAWGVMGTYWATIGPLIVVGLMSRIKSINSIFLREPYIIALLISFVPSFLSTAKYGGGLHGFTLPTALGIIFAWRYVDIRSATNVAAAIISMTWALFGAPYMKIYDYAHATQRNYFEIDRRLTAVAREILPNAEGPIWAMFHSGILDEIGRKNEGPSQSVIVVFQRDSGKPLPQLMSDLNERWWGTIVFTPLGETYLKQSMPEAYELLKRMYLRTVDRGLVVFRRPEITK